MPAIKKEYSWDRFGFSWAIQFAREEKGWCRKDVAEKLKLSELSYLKYEEQADFPGRERDLYQLADLLGVDPQDYGYVPVSVRKRREGRL